MLTRLVSESLGLYEKLPQAVVVVGGITLGGKDEGAFGWLLACLAGALPSLPPTLPPLFL